MSFISHPWRPATWRMERDGRASGKTDCESPRSNRARGRIAQTVGDASLGTGRGSASSENALRGALGRWRGKKCAIFRLLISYCCLFFIFCIFLFFFGLSFIFLCDWQGQSPTASVALILHCPSKMTARCLRMQGASQLAGCPKNGSENDPLLCPEREDPICPANDTSAPTLALRGAWPTATVFPTKTPFRTLRIPVRHCKPHDQAGNGNGNATCVQ